MLRPCEVPGGEWTVSVCHQRKKGTVFFSLASATRVFCQVQWWGLGFDVANARHFSVCARGREKAEQKKEGELDWASHLSLLWCLPFLPLISGMLTLYKGSCESCSLWRKGRTPKIKDAFFFFCTLKKNGNNNLASGPLGKSVFSPLNF